MTVITGETLPEPEPAIFIDCPLMTIDEPEDASEIVWLPAVIAGPPGTIVCEPMTNWEALFAVTCEEPTVITGAGAVAGIGSNSADVRPFTSMAVAEGASEKTLPAIVTAEPPGAIVWEPMTKFDALFCLTIAVPMVRTAGIPATLPAGARIEVRPLTTNANVDDSSENVVPSAKTGALPGRSV